MNSALCWILRQTPAEHNEVKYLFQKNSDCAIVHRRSFLRCRLDSWSYIRVKRIAIFFCSAICFL